MAGEMNNFRTGTQLRARTSRVPSSQSTGHARIRTRGKGATDTVTHPPARSTILVSFIFHCGQLFRAPTVPIGCPISSKPSRTTGSPLIPQQGSDKPTRPSRDACEPRGSTRFLRFFPTLLLYFPLSFRQISFRESRFLDLFAYCSRNDPLRKDSGYRECVVRQTRVNPVDRID